MVPNVVEAIPPHPAAIWFVGLLPGIWLTSLLLVYYANQGIAILSSTSNDEHVTADAVATLSELESDLGAMDDILYYSIIFIGATAWFVGFTLFFIFFPSTIAWTLILLQLVTLVLLTLPFNLFYSFGSCFLACLRGVGKTKSIMMEVVYDSLAVATLYSRYIVQHVRLLLIFMAFFDLIELVYGSLDLGGVTFISQLFSFTSNAIGLFFTNYWYDWLGDILNSHLLLLYYCVHVTYSFASQLSNYLSLTIFLVCYLYTGFVDEVYEQYFLNLRTK